MRQIAGALCLPVLVLAITARAATASGNEIHVQVSGLQSGNTILIKDSAADQLTIPDSNQPNAKLNGLFTINTAMAANETVSLGVNAGYTPGLACNIKGNKVTVEETAANPIQVVCVNNQPIQNAGGAADGSSSSGQPALSQSDEDDTPALSVGQGQASGRGSSAPMLDNDQADSEDNLTLPSVKGSKNAGTQNNKITGSSSGNSGGSEIISASSAPATSNIHITSTTASVYKQFGCQFYTANDWFTCDLMKGGCPGISNQVDSNSANIINNFISYFGDVSFDINASTAFVTKCGTPMNVADNTTSVQTNQGCIWGCNNDSHNDDWAPGNSCYSGNSSCQWQLPVPSNLVYEEGCGKDYHAAVINNQACIAYDTYNHTDPWNGSVFSSSSSNVTNLNLSWNTQWGWLQSNGVNGGSNQAGLPMEGTTIFGEDASLAEITHILPLIIPGQDDESLGAGNYVEPATNGAMCDTTDYPNQNCSLALPFGARLQLNPSYPCPTSPQANLLCTAMKHYGVVVIDHGGTGLYFPLSLKSDGTNPWNESDVSNLDSIQLSDFQIMTLGTIYPPH